MRAEGRKGHFIVLFLFFDESSWVGRGLGC